MGREPSIQDASAAMESARAGYLAVLVLVLGHDSGLLGSFAAGPVRAESLAREDGTDPRMTLEWLRAMVVCGFATYHDGVFSPVSGLQNLVDESEAVSLARLLSLRVHREPVVMDRLARAVQRGGGVPHEVYEPLASLAQDRFNQMVAGPRLVPDLLGSIPHLLDRLTSGCSVLDLGCGGGWALEVLARHFPASSFTGFDLDPHALRLARQRLQKLPVVVNLEVRGATDLPSSAFDVVLAIDVVHDLADPSGALQAVQAALRPGGMLVMLETDATGDFELDRNSTARLDYVTSLLLCIPTSQASGGPGLGSMWGRAGALELLSAAGFDNITVHHADPGYAVFVAHG